MVFDVGRIGFKRGRDQIERELLARDRRRLENPLLVGKQAGQLHFDSLPKTHEPPIIDLLGVAAEPPAPSVLLDRLIGH
jgi:hypothetical protein